MDILLAAVAAGLTLSAAALAVAALVKINSDIFFINYYVNLLKFIIQKNSSSFLRVKFEPV